MEQEGRSVTFVLPSLPPSVNSLYQVIYSQRRVELKPEARRWKSDMKQYVPRFKVGEGTELRIDLEFNFNYVRRRFDAANLMKLAIDCICEKLGINDKAVRHGSWCSINNTEREFVQVVLTEITEVEWR
jgi:Holliday junction resolvase RusA-like endonuclease